ncbi:MAG: hypothetical protein HY072_09250 [Deltaproteobacteria bacterium]|nr:hypothetical protein [Deltaproteobacteria bacterium]
MQKTCKQCEIKFEIDQLDLDFYKKINVPVPTLCSECRLKRRQIFRNDRVFYNRKCDLSGKQFISTYEPNRGYKVYHPDEWYSDKWDAMVYGRDFDFNKPFFEQFDALMHAVPRLGIDIVNCENSYYCNFCGDDKNCYLDIAGEGNEDCYFNLFVKHSKNVVDCTFVYNSTLCCECINCYDCYNVQHSTYCENSSDCLFCFDLKGCRNCLFSSGLRNKEYFIFNKQHSKEEYGKYLENLQLGSYVQREKLKAGWDKFKRENAIFRGNYFLNCENVSGDDIKNSKNTFHSFNVLNCEDCKYLYDVLDAKDCQDLNYSLYKPELSYELISTLNMVKSAFSLESHYCNEVYYCDMVNNSKNLFGCIGLNHKQYCILNKQYSREEYEKLVPKIIEKMRLDGEWGEFFPFDISPFAYSETVAQEYFSLKVERTKSEKIYQGPEFQLPDNIKDLPDDLVKQILICEKSEKPYRVIEAELKFYKRMNIPVPHLSPDQRHLERMSLRNPRKLFDRKCSNCGQQIESTFTANRPEKVYCEQCYLKVVY